jgi:hypothetical protein
VFVYRLTDPRLLVRDTKSNKETFSTAVVALCTLDDYFRHFGIYIAEFGCAAETYTVRCVASSILLGTGDAFCRLNPCLLNRH